MKTLWRATAVMASIVLAGCAEAGTPSEPVISADVSREGFPEGTGAPGAVFVASNAVNGNQVMRFARAANGNLSGPVLFATGGAGTGGGLGNQSGVVLSDNRRWLLVVNAGSNELSLFRVTSGGLVLVDRVSSGGVRPVSVALFGSLVYVLNAGGTGNLSGFLLTGDRLKPLSNSTRPLSSAAAGAAQAGFSPNGRRLVVTEKATNTISVYSIGSDGRASGPNAQPSRGATPFGFSFDRSGILVVSEAFGGAPGAAALSSYRVLDGGVLSVLSASVGTLQSAACWVVITPNGRYAYTSNTGSGTISGFALGGTGALSRLDTDGITGTAGVGPIDLALSGNGRYLYSLNSGPGSISAFQVGGGGSLSPLSVTTGVPAGANGMAAY